MNDDGLLQELLDVQRELLNWQRAVSIPHVRDALTAVLGSDQQKIAYELCDGEATLREIAGGAGVSLGSVAGWTRGWRDAGLAVETADRRIRHLVSLPSVGITVPPPPKRKRAGDVEGSK